MIIVLIRTLIIFLTVVVVMRIMGKEQIGQLQPFEFVIAIMIPNLATIPMQNPEIPLNHGIIAIFTILVLQYTLSFATLKSLKIRKIVCGKPSILIENGKINEKELIKNRYNINDLLEQLRLKSYPNIHDIEYAILESKGDLSIIPKSQKRPLIPEDLNIPTFYEGVPITLISDGEILYENLKKIKKDETWLLEEIRKSEITSPLKVLLASINSQGQIYIQRKDA